MNAETTWDNAENILCVRLDTMGDVLMTGPAIRALKQGRAGRRVTLLTSGAGAAVVPLLPEIDECIVYEAPWLKATAPRANSGPDYAMIERLRAGGFDAAVIFTVYSQNPLPAAFLCYMADIPLRLAHCHENTYQMLTDWVPDPEPAGEIRHEVRRQLDLVEAVGCRLGDERMRVRVPDAAYDQARAQLAAAGVDIMRPWLVIHPGATAASRRYPPAGFAAAIRRLVGEAGFQVVITGTGAERDLIAGIQAAAGVHTQAFVDTFDLSGMAALLDLAPLLLSNNTGPVHLAAALGTPVVDLYALTNPQHTPWMVPSRVLNHDVPCRWCYKSICPQGHHHCLRLVTPDQIVDAVTALYAETARPAPVLEVAV